MSHFFQATSKVQKDRQVMRDTDSRMAKYSRRGLILNFIASIFCILSGEFIQQAPNLAIGLIVGLLLLTLFRGYFLFRFDQLYPRGPKRWRNKYFVITLMGALWWSAILVSITLVLGMQRETSLLWFYTVIFFSTTAHAFAPYHIFLAYYQFLGLVPAAVAAIIVGGPMGYLFGLLMLMFFLLISRQCRLISDNYWEKLEAGYALGKRAIQDEKERISSRAKLDLSREFIDNLQHEIAQKTEALPQTEKASNARSLLHSVGSDLSLFYDVISKKVEVQNTVFNVRHEIQFLVSELVDRADEKHIQVETSLSPALPMRLKGDPVKFGKIVQTLLEVMLDSERAAAVILEVQFLREYETAGELYVTARRIRERGGIQFFSESLTETTPNSLGLTICKALAELMNGEVDVLTSQKGDHYIQFNARFDIADQSGKMDFHKGRFSGENILLIGSNPAIVDIKRQELDALGFSTAVETVYKRVKSRLIQSIDSGSPIQSLLIFHESDNSACLELLESLKASDRLRFVNKLVSVSANTQKNLMDEGYTAEQGFFFVTKPTGLFELESTFEFVLSSKGSKSELSKLGSGTIIVAGDSDDSSAIAEHCEIEGQKVVVASVQKLETELNKAFNPMVVIPCLEQEHASEIVNVIRRYEENNAQTGTFIPIIGVGEGVNARDSAAFEMGLDDYIDLSSQRSKTLSSMLRYWRSLDL